MADLEFPDVKTPLYGSAKAFHRVKRCPAQGLVDSYYLSAYKIHFYSVIGQNSNILFHLQRRQIIPITMQ